MKRFLLLFFTALLLISCSKEDQKQEAISLAEAELFNSQKFLQASITTRGMLAEEDILLLIESIEKETTVTTQTTKVDSTTKVSTTTKPITTAKVTTTTKPTTTTTIQTTSGDFSYSNEALDVFRLDNEKREAVGKSALVLDEALTKAANARAKELVTKFSHTRPNGTNYATILSSYGKETSEIIAWGYNSPKDVVDGWMNSAVHKANILDSNNRGFTKVGIGYYNSNGKKYWVQIFAK